MLIVSNERIIMLALGACLNDLKRLFLQPARKLFDLFDEFEKF